VRYRYRVGALLFLLAVINVSRPRLHIVAGPRIQEYLHILGRSSGAGLWEPLPLPMPYLKFQAGGWPIASAHVSH
jgi:hypothetical protein